MIISKTGEIHGRGCDKWKWVSRLTAGERAAVLAGDTVLIETPYDHHTATRYKKVMRSATGQYYHRNYYGKLPTLDREDK